MRTLRIYKNTVEKLAKEDARLFLNGADGFKVFVEYICPKKDILIQEYIELWKPVYTTCGVRFLAEIDGVTLKIPSDFEWWSITDGEEISKTISISSAVLVKGEHVTKNFNIKISRAIRLI